MNLTIHEYKANNRTKILNDIHQERSRQDHLHPQELPLAMRFVTIMEESGEVAQALQDKDMKSVYRELIETAASCVRMAEQVIEVGDPWKNNSRK